MTVPAALARDRDDRSHHWTVQALGALAADYTAAADQYSGHVGQGEAIAQQSLLRGAATLRLVAALVIRGNITDAQAYLWIDAAATVLGRVADALRVTTKGTDHGQA